MPPTYRAGRLVVHGDFSSAGTWSFGLNCNLTAGTPTPTEMTEWAASAAVDAHDLWTTSGSGIQELNAGDTRLLGVRSYYYPALGSPATVVGEDLLDTPDGGTGTTPHDYRSCVVASLLTGQSGRHARGRIYLPATGMALSAHQLNATMTSHVATRVAAFIAALNTGGPGSLNATVIVAGSDVARPVVSVRVNSLMDTQRRRQDHAVAITVESEDV